MAIIRPDEEGLKRHLEYLYLVRENIRVELRSKTFSYDFAGVKIHEEELKEIEKNIQQTILEIETAKMRKRAQAIAKWLS